MYMSVFKLWVFKHTEWASQVALVVENLPINEGGARDGGVYPWVGRTPGGGHNNPLQVFLPGDSHGQGSLTGYSP